MKNYRKLLYSFIIVLIVFSMVFSLAGCGGSPTAENSSEASSKTSSISGGGRVEANSENSKNHGTGNLLGGGSSSENSSSDDSRNQTPTSSKQNTSKYDTYIPSFPSSYEEPSSSSSSSSSSSKDDSSRNSSAGGWNPSSSSSKPSSSTPQSVNTGSSIDNSVSVPQTKMGRTLVWNDEFNGTTLNSLKWHFSRTMGADDRLYTNDSTHAYMESGTFIMKAFRSRLNNNLFSLPEGLNTKNTMNFKYGYVEMRAKIPMRQGAWPSFWMLSDTVFQTANWMSEIDIFEVFGHDRDLYITLHKHGGSGVGSYSLPTKKIRFIKGSHIYRFSSGKGNDTYHIFGLEWTPSYIKFMVDGTVFATVPIDKTTVASWGDPIKNADGYHDFHYIIMNNELLTEGGWYKHSAESRVKDNTPFPFTYTIDYVRLYQKAGEELKIKKDIDAAR